MTDRKFHLHNSRGGSSLAVRVTPRSRRNEIAEILSDGSIRVRLTATSADAETNKALIDYLSQVLDLNASQFEIVAGISGRDKLIAILDMDSATLHQKILQHLQ